MELDMKLLRFITEEERTLLDKLSSEPELIIAGASHTHLYYGVRYKSDLSQDAEDKLDLINTILSQVIGGFSSFSNFTPDKCIRFQYAWDSSFTGVGYLTLDQLSTGFNPGEAQA